MIAQVSSWKQTAAAVCAWQAEHHMMLLRHAQREKVTPDATATAEAIRRQRQGLQGRQRQQEHSRQVGRQKSVKVTSDATATAEAIRRQRQGLLGQQRRQEHSQRVGRQQQFHSQGSRLDSLDICRKLEGEPVRIFKEPAGGQKSELTTWTTCCQSRQNHNSSNRSVVVDRKKQQTMATYKKLTDSAGDRSSKGKKMERAAACVLTLLSHL